MGGWRARTFAALRHRNYRLFFVGQGLSAVGSWSRSTAQAWLVHELTKSERWLGWVAAASLLPIALLAWLAGAVVDRADKRRLLLWTQIAEMALSTCLFGLVVAGRVEPEHVLVLAAAMGVCVAFEMPARQAFVVELVGKDGLRNAVAMNSLMFNLALVLGPALAGALMATVGIWACFAFDAISFLFAIVGFARMDLPPHVAPPRHESFWAHVRAGLRYVAGHRRVRSLLILLAVAMFFGWSYSAVLAAFAEKLLGADGGDYGLLVASSGVGAVAGALWVAGHHASHDGERRPERTVFGSLIVFCLSVVGFAAVRDVAAAAALRAVAGFCMISFFSTSNGMIQTAVPDGLRGRVMGLWTLVFGASLPLGQLVVGDVAERVGVAPAIAGGALVCLAAVLAFAFARPLNAE
jgi:MFS family permease